MTGPRARRAAFTFPPRCAYCTQRRPPAGHGLCGPCHRRPDVLARFAGPPPPCRHCGRPATRARRLCYACYKDPAVRASFRPAVARGFAPGAGLGPGAGRRLPAEPTDALPGTPEKVEVLRLRASRGERLFHPRDARR